MKRLLAVLCLAQLATVLDNTILNLAVPAISADLGTGTAGIQWIIGSYSIIQAGCLLAAGAAADRYGRKRLLLQGLVVFGAGSVAAALSGSTSALIASRSLMGLGGALVGTATLAVALQVFDGEARTRAIGAWAAVSALGFALGPPLGGLVLAHFSWPAVFLLNVPVVLVAFVGVRCLAPESSSSTGAPDVVGAVLSTLGLGLVSAAVIVVPDHSLWVALALALVGVRVLVAFLRWERIFPHPMLDLALLRDRRLSGALSGIVLITFGSGGVLLLLSLQVQLVRGYAPLEAGLRLAPFALAIVVVTASGLAARALARLGTPLAIAAGMTSLAVGFAMTALPSAYPVLLVGLLLSGAGCALANLALIGAVTSAIPLDRAGIGAGLNGVTAELGASLGFATLGAVLHAHLSGPLAPGTPGLVAGLRDGQLLGALAVLAGGVLGAVLLRRAARVPACVGCQSCP